MSRTGQRCSARKFLEYDHVDEVARGGRSTVENLRLRCRAHNQHAAGRTFGAEFMRRRREAARHAREEAREIRAAEASEEAKQRGTDAAGEEAKQRDAQVAAARRAEEQDVIPWLRGLGCRPEDARRAARLCDDIPDAPLEERVKRALSYFGARFRKISYAQVSTQEAQGEPVYERGAPM